MTETTTPAAPSAFRRRTRAAAAVASGGMLVGLGSVGVAPAFAATEADCDGANTLTAPADGVAALEALLDANTPIVCLEGTFTFTAGQGPLLFDHDLTLFGLDAAVLDGAGVSGLLQGNDNADLTVQNLSFVNGLSASGGAISVNGALVVEDSTFEDNVAGDSGGAIYVFSTDPVTIERSTFSGNSSQEDGGAVYIQTSDGGADTSVAVIDSEFTDNVAGGVEGFGYSGGAMFTDVDDDVVIEGSSFLRNSASEFGGAVYGTSVVAFESVFTDNEALVGGGLYAAEGALVESTFASNEAAAGGAATIEAYGVVVGSTFVENTAFFDDGVQSGGFGGAISGGYFDGGVIVQNSTFVGNTADGPVSFGGAMAVGQAIVLLSTFLDNTASNSDPDEHSDSLFLFGEGTTKVVVGSIFAGSREVRHLGSDFGDYQDAGGNVFSTLESTETAIDTPHPTTQFGRSSTSIFGADPQLDDNGGSTETLSLVAGSPAIDAVPADVFITTAPALGPASGGLSPAIEVFPELLTPDQDQRGVERTGVIDAGAYEFGDAELAATGSDPVATGWLAGIAALLLGGGAAALLVSRRSARTRR